MLHFASIVTFCGVTSALKKLHQDHADPVSVDINSSAVPVSVDTNSSADPVRVDTSSSASAQAELPLRRSARVFKPPRRLIQEM